MKKALTLLAALLAAVASSAQVREELTLLFVGDVMQHARQIASARGADGKYAYDTCFHHVRGHIAAADLAVANFETTLPGPPYTGYPNFGSPDELAAAVQRAGFDVLVTSNNHSCDRGRVGVERTLRVLDSLGMQHTGTFHSELHREQHYPLIVNRKGFRLAFLNYTYGTNGIDTPAPTVVNRIDTVQMAADIAEAVRLQPDIIVACMHWGEEYKLSPSREQKTLADFLIRRGVRLVIGSHPHVLQPMERRGDGVVVWSLGNFISGMSAVNTEIGVMASMKLVRTPDGVVVDDCGYRLTWVSKPESGGRTRFLVIPVAEMEADTAFFTSSGEHARMVKSAEAMRTLFAKGNVGFPQLPPGIPPPTSTFGPLLPPAARLLPQTVSPGLPPDINFSVPLAGRLWCLPVTRSNPVPNNLDEQAVMRIFTTK